MISSSYVACDIVPVERFREIYQPDHRDADDDGYILMSDIDTSDEMAAMIDTQRAVEKLALTDEAGAAKCEERR